MTVWPSQRRHKEPPRSKSGYRGVIYSPRVTRKPWKAYARKNGQYVTLGYFATKEEAAKAYNAVAEAYHGIGTFLNPV